MYKQSPGRNHRSKGIRVKNVLQICLLLAVCFWLIYQVKHSHDKKKEIDDNDTKNPIETESGNELVKLGRKDLLPQIEGLGTVTENHREEQEDETVEEEEGNKPEEEDLEENNTKEKNDEQKEDGEDEVDDHDQEKSDVEPDQEEDVTDEDKERGEDIEKETDERGEDNEKETDERGEDNEKEIDERGEDNEKEIDERGEDNEKEIEVRDSEANDSQVEEENSLEDHDHDEDSSSSHEAREEHYKADDASSAVTHDTAVTATENDNGKLEQEVEHAAEAKSEVGVNNIMQINAGPNTSAALEVEDGKTVVDGPPQNTTNSEEKGDDPISSTARDTSVSNSTNTTSGVSNQSISSSQENNSTDMLDQIDSNITVSSKTNELDSTPVDSSNVTGDTEPSLAEKVVQGNATVEAVDNNATEVEKADTSSEEIGTTDEGIAENLGEVQDDPIDTSDSLTHLEEKHIRTDVETLPEIQTEGNMEDAAAE